MKQRKFLIIDKIPFIKLLINKKYSAIKEKYKSKIKQLLIILSAKSCFNPGNSIIASLTSYPPRINSCWISIISLLNQSSKVYKIVLVLSLVDFPSKKIPWTLKLLRFKGLEILWTDENYKVYGKLIPVKKKYPDSVIITFDDDVIYEKWRISNLISEHHIYPESIIGNRGREIKIKENNEVDSYLHWKICSKRLNSKYTFLTGVGGVLYPPNKLFDKLIEDFSLANELCPIADDVFFWAVAYYLNLNIICLGEKKIDDVYELRNSPKLWDSNRNLKSNLNNDIQIKAAIKHFGINF